MRVLSASNAYLGITELRDCNLVTCSSGKRALQRQSEIYFRRLPVMSGSRGASHRAVGHGFAQPVMLSAAQQRARHVVPRLLPSFAFNQAVRQPTMIQ